MTRQEFRFRMERATNQVSLVEDELLQNYCSRGDLAVELEDAVKTLENLLGALDRGEVM